MSGTVRDGSGHGWPLYARVDIAGHDAVFTDPVTGEFSVDLPAGGTYELTVDAVARGYAARSRTITVPTDGAQDFALEVEPSCTASGYGTSAGVALDEDFEGGLPAGWTVERRSPSGAGWAFDDPGQRGNLTGGSGRFAIADSDHVGNGTTTDTDLITAPLDLSTAHAPQVAFNSDFRDIGTQDRAQLAVSTDGGQNWTTLWEQTDTSRGPHRQQIAVPQAARQPDVRFRFHYFGTWDWWWQIDDIAVGDTCAVVPGGLVVGSVASGSTGEPLDGATVTGEDDARATTTGSDGLYTLFVQGGGPESITATADGHLPSTRQIDVAADRVARQDFALDEVVPPMSIALGRGATVRGVTLSTREVADIGGDGRLARSFDGRAAGVPAGGRIDGAANAPGGLVLSFADPVRLPGIAPVVDDSDAVLYAGGSFAQWFDGSDVGLSGDDEDIDALELLPDGRILVSTTGTATAAGVTARDEDVLALTPQSLGSATAGTWAVYLDGSDVGLSDSSEDVDGVAVRANGSIALSVRECLVVPGLRAGAADVAAFHPTRLGPDSAGSFAPELLLDGTTLGLRTNDVTAVELPR